MLVFGINTKLFILLVYIEQNEVWKEIQFHENHFFLLLLWNASLHHCTLNLPSLSLDIRSNRLAKSNFPGDSFNASCASIFLYPSFVKISLFLLNFNTFLSWLMSFLSSACNFCKIWGRLSTSVYLWIYSRKWIYEMRHQSYCLSQLKHSGRL